MNTDTHQVQVHKKPKRRPMSTRYTRKRVWCREDAEKVLELENQSTAPAPVLVIHFPDPELNSRMVKGFSSDIETVHFQIPYKARSCFVKLRQGADIENVCAEISKIPFGTGYLRAQEKYTKKTNKITSCEGIDPYTLYVGNLPANITVAEVKENFPTATYFDVGFAQKMKYTRYAFIQYATVEEAMEAYKKTMNLILGKRNVIVRFRRTKGNMGLPGDPKIQSNTKRARSNDSDCAIISDDCHEFPKPVVEGPPDSKDNVLKEAALLMRQMLERNEDFPLFSEDDPINQAITIKKEKVDEIDNSANGSDGGDDDDDDNDSDLLGTKVKQEPTDPFYEDQGCYSDINEEEDDEIPPELLNSTQMDDCTFPNAIFPDEEDDEDANSDNMCPDNWDKLRQKELEQTEEKPDITTLEQSKRDVSEVRPRPSLRLSDLVSDKQDGLDDLFRGLNSDSDDDL